MTVRSAYADPDPATVRAPGRVAPFRAPVPLPDGRAIDLLRLGRQLREIRLRHGLTRAAVEEISEGRWTATALGTYERGERVMTAPRLFALANFYRVPVATLLGAPALPPPMPTIGSVVVDAQRLAGCSRWPQLAMFVEAVQEARGGPRRRLVSLRGRDLPRLAAIHDTTIDQLVDSLKAVGAIVVGRC